MDSSEVKILLISTGGTIASENTDSGIAPKEGKIEGIVEKVRKAGYGVMAYVLISVDINMLRNLKKTQDMLLEELMQLPYVMDGNITTSEADVVLRIIAKDTQHLKEIILSNIQSKPGIVNTKTMVVLG